MVKLLVAFGANVNTVDENGLTPLLALLSSKDDGLFMVPLLLDLGADIRIGKKVISACEKRKSKALENLFEHILDFIVKLDEEEDFQRLNVQTDRILELKKYYKISQGLEDKTLEIREDYCFDDRSGEM